MYCHKCKAEKDKKPFQTARNKLYCPDCLARLFPDEEAVSVTPENTAMFTKSEILFSEGSLEKRREALALCRSAAMLRNPYAIVNTGYYYERGFFHSQNDGERIRNAFEWYDIIASRDKVYGAQVRLKPPSAGEDDSVPENLVETAVYNIFCLLQSDSASVLEGLLKLSKNEASKLLAKRLGLSYSAQTASSPMRAEGAAAFLEKTKNREVLFGARELDAAFIAEFSELAAGEGKQQAADFVKAYDVRLGYSVEGKGWQGFNPAGNVNDFLGKLNFADKKKKIFLAYWKKGEAKIAYKADVNNNSKFKRFKVRLSERSFLEALSELGLGREGAARGILNDYTADDAIVAHYYRDGREEAEADFA
ncbi:MAG TPA: hypothetical protein PK245_03240, partial [Clostridia bacterium]|nr:hypothetical protein [Clostridia bacterium]